MDPRRAQALPLPRLRRRVVDLEYVQRTEDVRTAVPEGVKTRTEDDVLLDPGLVTLEQTVLGVAVPVSP